MRSTWRSHAVALLCGVSAALLGCSDTRRDWGSCHHEACKEGVCTADGRCMPKAAGPDGGGSEAQRRLDVALPSLDVAGDADSSAVDAVAGDDVSLTAPDLALDGPAMGLDTPPGLSADAWIDGQAQLDLSPAVDLARDLAELAVDTRGPDAPGTCSSDNDCRSPTPACAANRCVECQTHADCPLPAKPICDVSANLCRPCASDRQCADQVPASPGVCMAHLDGRCASDAETIYVGSRGTVTCKDDAQGAGSAASPYCSVQKGILAARSKSKDLVVLSGAFTGGFSGINFTTPLTVVGKDAVITASDGADGIRVSSGELYLRGVKVTGSEAGQTRAGIEAQVGTGASLVLHLDGCEISGNPGGGILLAGAAFDIRDTVISDNGAGQTGAGVVFGGIRVDGLAASGPASLTRVTITGNRATGLSCSASIQGTGVLASGNTSVDIADSCGIASCASASASCGAQP